MAVSFALRIWQRLPNGKLELYGYWHAVVYS